MTVSHKDKTAATFLAAVFGTMGAHRCYLRGRGDPWLWAHLSSVPASLLIAALAPHADWFYKLLPLILSGLSGHLEALVLGLTPDQQWDAARNAGTDRQTASNWPLALLLVATLMVGAGVLIATIARFFDLLYTGGAYG